MPFNTLIDGYNLLFTAGFEGRSRQRGWLEKARQRLIKHLESCLPAEDHARTLVVFDVSVDVLKARQRELDETHFAKADETASSGIQVAFAFDYDEADDMLENLIRKHATPKSLTVVSSDHRIRKCAMATPRDFNRLGRVSQALGKQIGAHDRHLTTRSNVIL